MSLSAKPVACNDSAERLIDFLGPVFEARETKRVMRKDGKVAHADARIGDSTIMLADASSEWKPMPGAIACTAIVHANTQLPPGTRSIR